ncbi:MAG: 1,4-alpha-glucan branching protein GlgB [Phycisphaerales bacterium]
MPTPRPNDHQGGAPDAPLSSLDIHLLAEGTHYRLYEHLGAHRIENAESSGVRFAVWAPNARSVAVVGDFNRWAPDANPMRPIESSGVWTAFVPGLKRGDIYKYRIESHHNDNYTVLKADPFAFHAETPSATGSRVWDLHYQWNDNEWMATRHARQSLRSPISIYEMHLGSWMRSPDGGRFHTYRELATLLPAYLRQRGFTHVEFLPVMEHPLYRSWGYQTTGYFAPTSRLGTPQDLMHLIDTLHQHAIGVILDWVPSHFPSDEHALGYFDGTHLYEYADPREGFHPDWKSLIFNYARHEVRAFLISSALFWLDKYHADGIRVDAVASMLYRDYSRKHGEWIPNRHGGRENLEAIDFLQRLNSEIYRAFPDAQTFAEESTAWPGVSRPVHDDGLGFGFKWDMGWMNDTLAHLARDPILRSHHHTELTFRGMYMHSEHYVLPLSHDEVVHGKGSLYNKMHGDDWQKRANLRLLLALQWTQPGKKLLFMGAEIAQHAEWDHDAQLQWELLDRPEHLGIQRLVDRLNQLLRDQPALHERDADPQGFCWLIPDAPDEGILAYLRLADDPDATVLCAMNTTPVVREDVPIGVPRAGAWRELLNTDAHEYAGSGVGNLGSVRATPEPLHNQPASLRLTIPPLAALILRWEPES